MKARPFLAAVLAAAVLLLGLGIGGWWLLLQRSPLALQQHCTGLGQRAGHRRGGRSGRGHKTADHRRGGRSGRGHRTKNKWQALFLQDDESTTQVLHPSGSFPDPAWGAVAVGHCKEGA